MSTENDSRRTPAPQTNEARASGGRDARKGAQPREGDESTNKPPNHGRATNSPGAMFLEDVDPSTPISELAEKYTEWRGSQ